MTRRFQTTKFIPFLASLLKNVVPKFLDFTDFPIVKGEIEKQKKERIVIILSNIEKNSFHDYHIEILKLFLEKNEFEIAQLRFGPDKDGGYNLPVLVSKGSLWITIGLGTNVEFENELSYNNNLVKTFDHTLTYRPRNLNRSIKWYKYGYSPNKTHFTGTINDIMNLSEINSSIEWNLKVDIEGAEWTLFEEVIKLENRPVTLICEIHGLLYDPETFKSKLDTLIKLFSTYQIISLHGNNFSAYYINHEYGLYDVIEVTMILKTELNSFKSKHNTLNKMIHFRNDPYSYEAPMFLKLDKS